MLTHQEIIIRLLAAALLGGLVGFERERKDWAVGIRTHMLASVAAALVMMVSSFGFSDILVHPKVMLDPSRVASSVIIGIGYLGAGMILVLKPGNVKGLTTASGLWATAGIGLAAGGGMYFAAGITTVIVLVILYGIQVVQNRFALVSVYRTLVVVAESERVGNELFGRLNSGELKTSEITMKRKKESVVIVAHVTMPKKELAKTVKELQQFSGVRKVTVK